MTRATWLALLATGCVVHSSDPGYDDDRSWTDPDPVCHPAELANGANGGDAGTMDLEIDDSIGDLTTRSSGGLGGMAGQLLDDWGLNGEPGEAGYLNVAMGFGPVFDDAGIDPDSEISVGSDGGIVIRGVDLDASILEIDTLSVAADQQLHLFGSVVVRARTVRVGSGAVFHVHAGDGPLALATTAPDAPSLDGGTAILTAGLVELGGAIDVSGADGTEPGERGGHGGDLVVRAEQVLWTGGVLVANGGTGADGIDVECVE